MRNPQPDCSQALNNLWCQISDIPKDTIQRYNLFLQNILGDNNTNKEYLSDGHGKYIQLLYQITGLTGSITSILNNFQNINKTNKYNHLISESDGKSDLVQLPAPIMDYHNYHTSSPTHKAIYHLLLYSYIKNQLNNANAQTPLDEQGPGAPVFSSY